MMGNRISKFLWAITATILLSACADSHQLMRNDGNLAKLDPKKSVYVSIPNDGQYGQITYHGSGQNTSQIIVLAFSHHAQIVESGHERQSYKDAMESARNADASYLVLPTILEWEDRATEWSAIPDKASIKIAIVDTKNESTIDSVIIKGKSGLATFGGDHPQDLLPKPVTEYVDSLY